MNLKLLLKDFKDLDNIFGDVAKDVIADKSFPKNIYRPNDLPSNFAANEQCMNVFYYFALEENLCYIEDDKILWNQN